MLLENVTIKIVGPERSGISTTTGKRWSSRSILLAWEDATGESYISAAVDCDIWKRLGYVEGQTVNVHLRCRTKQFSNGFLSNDIRIVEPQNT